MIETKRENMVDAAFMAREQQMVRDAVEATQKAMVQNVEWEEKPTATLDLATLYTHISELVIPEGVTSFNVTDEEGMPIYDAVHYITAGGTKFKKIVLPGSMKTIPEGWAGSVAGTFVQEIVLSEGITAIGNGALDDVGLEKITLPTTLITIGENAFTCNPLTEVVIPPNVTTIGANAFLMNRFTEVTIPSSVIEIGERAFGEMSTLSKIIINKPEGSIAGAPWGATNATIHYNYTGGEA